MSGAQLLGSSSTLEGIGHMVTAFYCGEPKTLRPVHDSEWEVVKASGQPCPGVRIIHKRNRYRFEMVGMGYTPKRGPQRATDAEKREELRNEVTNQGDC